MSKNIDINTQLEINNEIDEKTKKLRMNKIKSVKEKDLYINELSKQVYNKRQKINNHEFNIIHDYEC